MTPLEQAQALLATDPPLPGDDLYSRLEALERQSAAHPDMDHDHVWGWLFEAAFILTGGSAKLR